MSNGFVGSHAMRTVARVFAIGTRKRYLVIVWPSTAERPLCAYRSDSKVTACTWALRWFPGKTSRGSIVWDRRAHRVILDTCAAAIAKAWAEQLTAHA